MLGGDVPDNRRAAGALDAGYENVVSRAGHVEPEINGVYGPFLADDFIQWFDFCRVFELEDSGVTGVAQFECSQFTGFLHQQLLYIIRVSQIFFDRKMSRTPVPRIE